MTPSERFAAGFALAAAAHADRGARLALPGLAAELSSPATHLAEQVAELDPHARHGFIRGLLRAPAIAASADACHPRALSLLAAFAERERGRQWLARAPRTRPGYAPDPALIALLRKLATQPARAPEKQAPA